MRKIIIGGLLMLLGACATVPAENLRLTEARSLVRQQTETHVDLAIASLSEGGVLGDIDCDQETGVDAKQCIAFSTMLASRMEPLKAEQRKIALTDAADEMEALAEAMTKLSEADFSQIRINANLPMGSDLAKSISQEGDALIMKQENALISSLVDSDQKAGDRAQAVAMEILTKLLADPTLH